MVLSGGGAIRVQKLPELATVWEVPQECGPGALSVLEIDPSELEEDHLTIWLRSNQTAVLSDWFGDRGFIVALQRLVIAEV